MSRWLSLSILAVGFFSFASTAVAQDDALVEIYGQGLHRYFAGNYQEAERLLSLVVDSGSEDPRAHYFRGLSQYMQGRKHEAKIDFESGALAEARGRRVVPVGTALQRIQGSMRMEIEKARQAARVAVLVAQAQQRRSREDAARTQGAAMRDSASTQPALPAPPPPTMSDATDPFKGAGGLQAGNPSEDASKPATPAADAATNPFGDDPGQVAPGTMPAPADADPFGGPATPATPAEPPAADPFSTPTTPPAADPFSTPATPPAAEPAAADPFSTPSPTPPAGDANPFGS